MSYLHAFRKWRAVLKDLFFGVLIHTWWLSHYKIWPFFLLQSNYASLALHTYTGEWTHPVYFAVKLFLAVSRRQVDNMYSSVATINLGLFFKGRRCTEEFKQSLATMCVNFVNRMSMMCIYSLMYSTLSRESKLASDVFSCLERNFFPESWFWRFYWEFIIYFDEELLIKQTKGVMINSIHFFLFRNSHLFPNILLVFFKLFSSLVLWEKVAF